MKMNISIKQQHQQHTKTYKFESFYLSKCLNRCYMYPFILVLEKKLLQIQPLVEYILATPSLILPCIRITKHTR